MTVTKDPMTVFVCCLNPERKVVSNKQYIFFGVPCYYVTWVFCLRVDGWQTLFGSGILHQKKTLNASVPRRYRYWRLCNVHAAQVCSWQMIIKWANSAPHAGLLQFTQLINFNYAVPVNWTPLRIRVYLTSSEHWVAIGGATSKPGDISCIQLGGTPQAPPFVTRWYWRSPRLAAEGWTGIVETRN